VCVIEEAEKEDGRGYIYLLARHEGTRKEETKINC
jgi:hypothetical protein